MSDDWENDDFEPTIPSGPAPVSDKWDGEDEDDNVKDNWEDEDEEKEKEEVKTEKTAYQRPKKKPLAERIAEKSRAKEEEEKKQEPVEMTPEEKLAEKIRLRKVQEEADLKLAKGLFGVDGQGASGNIDSMLPETKEEFDDLEEALKKKITFFEGSKFYAAFVEKLFHDISLTLSNEDIKKIGISLTTLYHEKERQRKEQAKNQKKKKVKATIRMDKADDLGLADGSGGGAYYDDDDDFI